MEILIANKTHTKFTKAIFDSISEWDKVNGISMTKKHLSTLFISKNKG